MTQYGRKAAWKNIGLNCILYGLTVAVFGLLLAVLFQIAIPMTPSTYFMENPEYLLVLAAPAIGILTFNYFRKDVRSCSLTSELAIAAAVLLGLSMPVTAIGILLLAITVPEYKGVERWLPDVKDRSYYELSELRRVITDLELSKQVQERSEEIMERARDRDLLSGRSFSAVLGGIIYIVAREEGEPRTLDEISEAVKEEKRDVGKAYRYIGRELDLQIVPPRPEDFTERFSAKLGLSEEVAVNAKELTRKAREKGLISGKSSKGIAAASIYIAAYQEGEKRSLNEMADILKITTVTIRERAKDLVRELELEEVPGNLEQ